MHPEERRFRATFEKYLDHLPAISCWDIGHLLALLTIFRIYRDEKYRGDTVKARLAVIGLILGLARKCERNRNVFFTGKRLLELDFSYLEKNPRRRLQLATFDWLVVSFPDEPVHCYPQRDLYRTFHTRGLGSGRNTLR